MVPSPKKAYGDEQEFYIFLVFHNRCHMVFTIRPFDSVENLFQMAFYFNKTEQSALLLHRNVSYSFKGKQKNINFNCHGHISNYGIKLRALTIKPQTVP